MAARRRHAVHVIVDDADERRVQAFDAAQAHLAAIAAEPPPMMRARLARRQRRRRYIDVWLCIYQCAVSLLLCASELWNPLAPPLFVLALSLAHERLDMYGGVPGITASVLFLGRIGGGVSGIEGLAAAWVARTRLLVQFALPLAFTWLGHFPSMLEIARRGDMARTCVVSAVVVHVYLRAWDAPPRTRAFALAAALAAAAFMDVRWFAVAQLSLFVWPPVAVAERAFARLSKMKL